MAHAVCYQQGGQCSECNSKTGTLYVLDDEGTKKGCRCAHCFVKRLVSGKHEIEADESERALFVLTVADAQFEAMRLIGRKLSDSELYRVAKGLQFGLECWNEVMKTAIIEIENIERGD